jgi:RIO-like serine/threonine protein kinase
MPRGPQGVIGCGHQLWVAHYDLNEVNVLIDEDCNVTGLVDWELSTPLEYDRNKSRKEEA